MVSILTTWLPNTELSVKLSRLDDWLLFVQAFTSLSRNIHGHWQITTADEDAMYHLKKREVRQRTCCDQFVCSLVISVRNNDPGDSYCVKHDLAWDSRLSLGAMITMMHQVRTSTFTCTKTPSARQRRTGDAQIQRLAAVFSRRDRPCRLPHKTHKRTRKARPASTKSAFNLQFVVDDWLEYYISEEEVLTAWQPSWITDTEINYWNNSSFDAALDSKQRILLS
jgi:hypothetical protein